MPRLNWLRALPQPLVVPKVITLRDARRRADADRAAARRLAEAARGGDYSRQCAEKLRRGAGLVSDLLFLRKKEKKGSSTFRDPIKRLIAPADVLGVGCLVGFTRLRDPRRRNKPLDRGALSQCAGCRGFQASPVLYPLHRRHPHSGTNPLGNFAVPSRWSTRCFGALGLEKHSDKTFIGRIERGFDFLGHHFSLAGLTVAKQTLSNFVEKTSQLNGPQPAAL